MEKKIQILRKRALPSDTSTLNIQERQLELDKLTKDDIISDVDAFALMETIKAPTIEPPTNNLLKLKYISYFLVPIVGSSKTHTYTKGFQSDFDTKIYDVNYKNYRYIEKYTNMQLVGVQIPTSINYNNVIKMSFHPDYRDLMLYGSYDLYAYDEFRFIGEYGPIGANDYKNEYMKFNIGKLNMIYFKSDDELNAFVDKYLDFIKQWLTYQHRQHAIFYDFLKPNYNINPISLIQHITKLNYIKDFEIFSKYVHNILNSDKSKYSNARLPVSAYSEPSALIFLKSCNLLNLYNNYVIYGVKHNRTDKLYQDLLDDKYAKIATYRFEINKNKYKFKNAFLNLLATEKYNKQYNKLKDKERKNILRSYDELKKYVKNDCRHIELRNDFDKDPQLFTELTTTYFQYNAQKLHQFDELIACSVCKFKDFCPHIVYLLLNELQKTINVFGQTNESNPNINCKICGVLLEHKLEVMDVIFNTDGSTRVNTIEDELATEIFIETTKLYGNTLNAKHYNKKTVVRRVAGQIHELIKNHSQKINRMRGVLDSDKQKLIQINIIVYIVVAFMRLTQANPGITFKKLETRGRPDIQQLLNHVMNVVFNYAKGLISTTINKQFIKSIVITAYKEIDRGNIVPEIEENGKLEDANGAIYTLSMMKMTWSSVARPIGHLKRAHTLTVDDLYKFKPGPYPKLDKSKYSINGLMKYNNEIYRILMRTTIDNIIAEVLDTSTGPDEDCVKISQNILYVIRDAIFDRAHSKFLYSSIKLTNSGVGDLSLLYDKKGKRLERESYTVKNIKSGKISKIKKSDISKLLQENKLKDYKVIFTSGSEKVREKENDLILRNIRTNALVATFYAKYLLECPISETHEFKRISKDKSPVCVKCKFSKHDIYEQNDLYKKKYFDKFLAAENRKAAKVDVLSIPKPRVTDTIKLIEKKISIDKNNIKLVELKTGGKDIIFLGANEGTTSLEEANLDRNYTSRMDILNGYMTTSVTYIYKVQNGDKQTIEEMQLKNNEIQNISKMKAISLIPIIKQISQFRYNRNYSNGINYLINELMKFILTVNNVSNKVAKYIVSSLLKKDKLQMKPDLVAYYAIDRDVDVNKEYVDSEDITWTEEVDSEDKETDPLGMQDIDLGDDYDLETIDGEIRE